MGPAPAQADSKTAEQPIVIMCTLLSNQFTDDSFGAEVCWRKVRASRQSPIIVAAAPAYGDTNATHLPGCAVACCPPSYRLWRTRPLGNRPARALRRRAAAGRPGAIRAMDRRRA